MLDYDDDDDAITVKSHICSSQMLPIGINFWHTNYLVPKEPANILAIGTNANTAFRRLCVIIRYEEASIWVPFQVEQQQ